MPSDTDAGLIASLRGLGRDGRLLFLTRLLRMFAYGSLAVVLVLYLASLGIDPITIGLILTLTLIGDTLISLWLTTHADRIGRRRVLIVGSLLMAAAGIAFALDERRRAPDPRGDDRRHQPERQRGRAVPRDRAGGAQRDDPGRAADRHVRLVQPRRIRRHGGRVAGGGARHEALLGAGWSDVDAYRAIVLAYAALGLLMAGAFGLVGAGRRAAARPRTRMPRRRLAGSASGASRGRSSPGCRPCSRSTRSRAGSSRRR